jgi:hypothetical protein
VSDVGEIRHLVLSVRGALKWPKRRLRGLLTVDGRRANADETRDILLDELAKGHECLPIGEPCDGFSHTDGCPGHRGTVP